MAYLPPRRVGQGGVPVWDFSVCLLSVCLSVPGWVASDPPWRPALATPPGRPTLGDPPLATHPGRPALGDPPGRPTLGDPPRATHPGRPTLGDPPGATHLGRLTPLALIALWQV